MSVEFNYLPAGNGIKVPLFYAEMDNSQASYNDQSMRTLLIGQKLSAGSAAANTLVSVSSTGQAESLFGKGSMLARMVAQFRKSNPIGDLWAIAVPDNGSGVAATGSIAVTGPATASGTINLYIGGQLVQVAVSSGDSANTVAAAINTAINAATDLPVTSTVSTNTVSLTARWKGPTGNDIMVSDSYRGTAGGESVPAGIALAYTAMANGATNPLLTTAIANLGDEPFEFIVHPYTDSTSLDAFKSLMNDATGRWSYVKQLYGHVYTALRGTYSALISAGQARNDQHHTIVGFENDVQHPNWEFAAAHAGITSVYIAADPARPTQTGVLQDLIPPRSNNRFIFTERNALLGYGIATTKTVGGQILIERSVTTYQTNAYGQRDPSYLDSETLHQAGYVLRYLAGVITSKYPRHKLAKDGTIFGAGQAILTPATAKSELIAGYKALIDLGLVENLDAFTANLITEVDPQNPNRLNVLYPPDLVNQLRIFAVLFQFRLNY